ncbi:Retrograde regulation protein 2 [Fusarium culmorum]|uniref:Retrograde regulation protein 2 n=1 Tax=Fusarium culmorum TaxID=5516 RepID=A0A2T4GKI9_FUSCU|nr:Retrograde regulation protein 2 [Fusarium culmorum]
MEEVARTAHSIFRVSDRRRKQVPAVAFLINVLSNAIPHGIRLAHFCQGGVREGLLFKELPPSIRAQDPLEVTTQRFAPESAEMLCNLLIFSFPAPSRGGSRRFPASISKHVIRAFANTMYVHTIMDKELASTTAMYSTSTGLLAFTRGVSHQDRARLALMLESRYMGELPPRESKFKEALQSIISPEEVWWTAYLGRVGYLLGRLYPSGKVDESKPRVVLSSQWAWDLGHKKKGQGLQLTISVQRMKEDPAKLKKALRDHVNIVEKIEHILRLRSLMPRLELGYGGSMRKRWPTAKPNYLSPLSSSNEHTQIKQGAFWQKPCLNLQRTGHDSENTINRLPKTVHFDQDLERICFFLKTDQPSIVAISSCYVADNPRFYDNVAGTLVPENLSGLCRPLIFPSKTQRAGRCP